jgi:hypothetical protein
MIETRRSHQENVHTVRQFCSAHQRPSRLSLMSPPCCLEVPLGSQRPFLSLSLLSLPVVDGPSRSRDVRLRTNDRFQLNNVERKKIYTFVMRKVLMS